MIPACENFVKVRLQLYYVHTHWQMYHARDMADTVTTQETGIVFIGSQHWAQLLGFWEKFHGKTHLLPLCWCCRLYRRVSMWQQSHYRTMVQGISSAGVTDLSPPSQSWSQQMKGKYCSRWWIWKHSSGYTDMWYGKEASPLHTIINSQFKKILCQDTKFYE